MRPAAMRDPLEKPDGSSSMKTVAEERQGITDLEKRLLAIRCAIHESNHTTSMTIGETTRTISEWLVWKREIYPIESEWLSTTVKAIDQARAAAQSKGGKLLAEESDSSAADIIVNLDEAVLHKQIEALTVEYETLDGQLSLKNATVTITI